MKTLISSLIGAYFSISAMAEPIPPTLANISYGKHHLQILDFYKAASDNPTPVLLHIHGGGWMNGDKSGDIALLKDCLANGISVISINYRLIPDGIKESVVPPVKVCLEDSARALQYVRSRAEEWNLDPKRIALSGGSAGGFNALWLAFHPDMADTKSPDPVSRQSTRVSCVMAFVPQTSLDPRQLREWIPVFDYGHHAFSLPSFQAFVDQREKLLPEIQKYSPYEWASADDPPVFLFYDNPVTAETPADPTHSANLGAGLAQKLKETGAPFEFYHSGIGGGFPDLFGFVRRNLTK